MSKRVNRFGAKSADTEGKSKTEPGTNAPQDPKDQKTDKPANGSAQPPEVTVDEIKAIVADAVKNQFKSAPNQDEVAASVKTAVAKALADFKAIQDRDDLMSSIRETVKAVAAEVGETVRREKKPTHSTEQKSDHTIEIPHSFTKGNLPLHAKQLLNVLLRKPIDDGVSDEQLRRGKALGDAMYDRYKSGFAQGQKALTSTGAGTGDELVPTDLSSELQRRFFLSSDLAAAMAPSEINMPSNPYTLPLRGTRPTFFVNTTENNAATESNPATAGITLTAVKLMARVDFSYELDEDSIIPILPMLQQDMAEAAAESFEDAMINGDADGTHQDSDTQAIANAAAKAYDGIRKRVYAVAALKKDISTGGITDANLRTMKKAMGKYGKDVRQLVLIVGPAGINDVEGMAEVSTIDKFGPQATILRGMLAAWRGIPVITSAAVRENLNATGFYDGTTTNRGVVLLINRSEWLTGRRRDFLVELDKDIKTQTNVVVASYRRAFVPREALSATYTPGSAGFAYTV